MIHPDLIKPLVRKDPRVARLFPNWKDEEIAYFKKTGIFPIMHVLGIKQEIVDRHPWVAINMFHAFNEAKTHRHEAHGEPAHRAARLVSRGLGGAGRASSAATLGNTAAPSATSRTSTPSPATATIRA